MISYEQARQIAVERIGPDCGLVEDAGFEKPYGWYFLGQSKAYLESGNFRQMLVGSGGFIVERENGRIVEFGSCYPTDKWIALYETGFMTSKNLTVTAVFDMNLTVNLLSNLTMSYVIPEVKHGVTWEISQYYKHAELRKLLQELPCTFHNQMFLHRVRVFNRIDALGCCKYELTEAAANDTPES